MVNMTLEEFRDREVPGLMEIFDFTSNIAASGYTDSTAVRIPEMISAGCRISDTHFISETYLLNRKRSSLDLGIGYGVMGYRSFGARGCLARRGLSEEEEAECGGMVIDLPPFKQLRLPLGTAIRSRRSMREMTGGPVKIADLSTLLYYGDGISGELNMASEAQDLIPEKTLGTEYFASLRTAPSGGGLYPITLYLAVRNTEGIPDGIYRYLPLKHILSGVRRMDHGARTSLMDVCDWGSGIDPENINIFIFYVYSLYSNSGKYGDMALDFALIEAGQISENLHLSAAALGLSSCDIGGFGKYKAEKLLGIDGMNENVVNVTIIGR